MQISNEMKRFIIRIVLFILAIICVDQMLGRLLSHMVASIEHGGTGRDNYICRKSNEEILIFGSSRAEYHYNAEMIEKELGQTCLNCGEAGCGVLLAYGRLKMIQERYIPKIIIYELTPMYDYLVRDDNHTYLLRLKQYYDNPSIAQIFEDVDKTEKYKMMSLLYRHNSSFIQNIVVALFGISTEDDIQGFRPQKGAFDPMRIKEDKPLYSETNWEIDSLKLQYLASFMDLAKGSDLTIVISPVWYGQDSGILAPVKEMCAIRGIPIIDMSNDPKYLHNDNLFKEGTHLNEIGANDFTRDIIAKIN